MMVEATVERPSGMSAWARWLWRLAAVLGAIAAAILWGEVLGRTYCVPTPVNCWGWITWGWGLPSPEQFLRACGIVWAALGLVPLLVGLYVRGWIPRVLLATLSAMALAPLVLYAWVLVICAVVNVTRIGWRGW